jgi:hypothetical protein
VANFIGAGYKELLGDTNMDTHMYIHIHIYAHTYIYTYIYEDFYMCIFIRTYFRRGGNKELLGNTVYSI